MSDGGLGIIPKAFGGHCLLVSRCMTGEAVDEDDTNKRHLGGIVLPDWAADHSCWVEVLAVGGRLGQRCTKEHARLYRTSLINKYGMDGARIGRHWPDDIVGKLIYIPLPRLRDGNVTTDERIMQSPWSKIDHFVESTLPEAWMNPTKPEGE